MRGDLFSSVSLHGTPSAGGSISWHIFRPEYYDDPFLALFSLPKNTWELSFSSTVFENSVMHYGYEVRTPFTVGKKSVIIPSSDSVMTEFLKGEQHMATLSESA